MLSSRNNDLIPDGNKVVTLSTVRKEFRRALQTELVCGQQLFDVWINEEAGAAEGTANAWDECMGRLSNTDIVIVRFDGRVHCPLGCNPTGESSTNVRFLPRESGGHTG